MSRILGSDNDLFADYHPSLLSLPIPGGDLSTSAILRSGSASTLADQGSPFKPSNLTSIQHSTPYKKKPSKEGQVAGSPIKKDLLKEDPIEEGSVEEDTTEEGSVEEDTFQEDTFEEKSIEISASSTAVTSTATEPATDSIVKLD